jgi:hypothetical protein
MNQLLPILLIIFAFLMNMDCQAAPRNGQGTTSYASGKYVGEFWNGKPNGHGTYFFANGDQYDGEFRDGKLSGQGTLSFANGNEYVGEFRDNKQNGQGTFSFSDGRVLEGTWENGNFKSARKMSPENDAKKPPAPRIISKPKSKPAPQVNSRTSGSGFFVSKLGHIVTNEHVVKGCKLLTVGDSSNIQVRAELLGTDRHNDLALVRISSTEKMSAETKSLIRKFVNMLSPLSTNGLLRSKDVELGERLLVAGYPYGDAISSTIKVTGGMVSAVRGIGDNSARFQMDAAIQPGNSGGPIYDTDGSIVGVVVAQLNKLKVAKAIGSLPENVNFGIKASTVRQFLTSSGLPTKWSARTRSMSTKEVAKIAKNQTVMVICNQ